MSRRRQIVISESEGTYRIAVRKGLVDAPSLELAIIKAVQRMGIEGVELAPTLEAAEVLESLLGVKEPSLH